MSSSIIKALINSTIKEENKLQPLTFTLTNPGSNSIKTHIKGSPNISGLQYRLGTSGPWLPYDVNSSISLAGMGYSIQFQNTNDTLSIDKNNYFTFYITGSANASVSGNIISMVNYKELSTYCFYQLFRFCSIITDASELILPETTVNQCYNNLFYYCSKLITPPVLPATTLSSGCYSAMFQNCGKLSVAPELPATTLKSYCYNQMFEGCSSLTTPPVLPATTLADNCYEGMFNGCTSLAKAPELPATTLTYYCYKRMFSGCTSLTKAPFLPATSLKSDCYADMFKGCTSLNYIKVAFTDYYFSSCTSNWVQNVSPTGTFASTTTYSKIQFGPSYIPEGWAIEGRNIIYGSDETISYEINKDFQLNVNFKALPETTAPATVTIVEGTLPEGWSINGTTILGKSSSLDKISLKVKIEIAGYESYQKTINFNFYEEAKLTDYKLYIPFSDVDTALINDGDDANKFYLTQQNSLYKVNIVEVPDESGDKLIKCADFYEGSGYNCPTLRGNNTMYQNLLKGNNPWTIAFKAYFKGCVIPSNKTNNVIQMGNRYTVATRLRFGLRPINDRFYLYLDTYNMDDKDETQAEARSFDLNTWYNIVVTYENRTLKYYYNNVLVATTSINQDLNLDTVMSGYDKVFIGGYTDESAWNGNSPNCYMKDLLLFNKVLTEDEIKTLNSSDSEPDDEPETSLTKVKVYSSYLENKQIEGCYFNGIYTIKDPAQTGQSAVYVNEANGTELYHDYYWYLRPIGASFRPILLYNQNATNPWEFTSNDWYDDANLYGFTGTITLVTDEGGSSGGESGGESDTTKADYVVSGAGTEVVNGDYVAYESSWTAYKHTTNDIYLWYDSNLMKWYICMTGPGTTGVAEVYYETPVDCPDPTTAGWFTGEYAGSDPVPTVTKGGSSSGEFEGYTITFFRDMPDLQANYLKTTVPSWGDSSYTYYKHETMGIYLYTDFNYTVIRSFDASGFTNDYWFTATGQGLLDYVVEFIDKNSGAMHGAVFVKYGGESGDDADYTVTGAGTAAVNGYYYNTGETKGNYPVYANSNGVKLWFFNMMGGWVFSPDFTEATSNWYYHCEAYGDVTTGNWANDALYPTVDALGAAPLPTVTKGKVQI